MQRGGVNFFSLKETKYHEGGTDRKSQLRQDDAVQPIDGEHGARRQLAGRDGREARGQLQGREKADGGARRYSGSARHLFAFAVHARGNSLARSNDRRATRRRAEYRRRDQSRTQSLSHDAGARGGYTRCRRAQHDRRAQTRRRRDRRRRARNGARRACRSYKRAKRHGRKGADGARYRCGKVAARRRKRYLGNGVSRARRPFARDARGGEYRAPAVPRGKARRGRRS